MAEIEKKKALYIKAKSDSKVMLAEGSSLDLAEGDEIIFENEQFQEVGNVLKEGFVPNEEVGPAVTIIRKLTPKDKEQTIEKKTEARQLLIQCKEKVAKHGLSMEMLDADLSYDGKKLTFYFTAPGRVDFRSLVPDLASTFKKMIRLQQVGSRDRVKCVCSVGRCGRETCCRSFLKGDLETVTIDMAYTQNLGQMGANRVTGVCGKLQCCLKYELDNYNKKKKKLPEVGSEFKTKEGIGKVLAVNATKGTVSVELKSNKRILEVNC